MLFITLSLCFIVTAKSSSFWHGAFNDNERRNVASYTGCWKKEDTICVRRAADTAKWCAIPRVRFQCPRLCGVCAPFNPVCPEEYPFGCCWNGDRANDIVKSNCPQCKNRSPICVRHANVMKDDCDFSSKTELTRRLCPEVCGACHDYGFTPAHAPVPCEDSDERCGKMVDTSCCETSEILRDVCKKTCGICSKFN